MTEVKVSFKNCYGIKDLEHCLDFSCCSQNIIYAPNGTMKSSFAAIFQDYVDGSESKDRIYKEREAVRIIKNSDGSDLPPDSIFVIKPYNGSFKSDKISTLLVNQQLKQEYDKIFHAISVKKDTLLKLLKDAGGFGKGDDVGSLLSEDIIKDKNNFFMALKTLESEVDVEREQYLQNVTYNEIFNEKVIAFIKEESFQQKISDYINTYDNLISSSTFFKKGVFNHNNARDIAKSLKDKGFFKASHSVRVKYEDGFLEVENDEELTRVIEDEMRTILESSDLKESFEEIDRVLNKNIQMRRFRSYLIEHDYLISELSDLEKLKGKLWVSYLSKHRGEYHDLLKTHEAAMESIEKIINQANIESTKWQSVIDIFNSRFTVPFIVEVKNQRDVILNEKAPQIVFKFKGHYENEEINIQEKDLHEVLSRGELRALYLLNIIFEVEARKENSQQTLFIIDDIADSFDYKNKYAIIEYLNDIAKDSLFTQVILTHNFDFFRTITSRLDVKRKNIFQCLRTSDGITIKQLRYQNNPFDYWLDQFKNDARYLVALIPFVRNLAEFCRKEEQLTDLTSYLHIKEKTKTLQVRDLINTFSSVINLTLPNLDNQDSLVIDLIYDLALSNASERAEALELESKIILSIAIRLKAEEYMINKIQDDDFVKSINSNQTRILFDKFKEVINDDKTTILERVILMTPESIHLNSFMYEPILDMSSENLKNLFLGILDLSS